MPRISTFGEIVNAYRVYQLDPAGKIATADWVEAATDEQATTLARAFCTGGTPKVELWRGPRRIAILNCEDGRAGKA